MSVDPFSQKAAEDFLGGSTTAAKWPRVGYVVEGTVVSWEMSQQTDYTEGEPLFWDGNKKVVASKTMNHSRPVMQMVMEIQGDPTGETWEGQDYIRKELPDDDGSRAVYIKNALQAAVKEGLRKAGGKLEAGAYLRIERIADKPNPDRKRRPIHQYRAHWTPAAQNPKAATAFLNDADDDDPFA